MNKKEYKKKLEKEKRELREFREMDTTTSVKTGLIIAVCVVGFILLIFAFTKIKTGEWDLFTRKNETVYQAEIQSTKILCGSILNRADSEYYVLSFEMGEDEASLYGSLISRVSSTSTKPIYTLDLSNSRNNICMGESLNIVSNPAELKLVAPTLLKIKDGQIIGSYTTYETIKNEILSNVD